MLETLARDVDAQKKFGKSREKSRKDGGNNLGG
jgi:hypothetical protein